MASPLQLADLFTARVRELNSPLWGPAPQSDIPLISLAYGFADPALFPREELIAAAEQTVAADPDGALNYAPNYPGLITLVAERLRRQGIDAHEQRTLIGYGSSQILGLLPQVLVEPGDTVLVEAPTFLGAVGHFRRAGARLIGIPLDGNGMQTDILAQTLADLRRAGVRPKFIYSIPTFQNPTGTTMSFERRQQLVELAATYGVVVLEDDAYGSLRFRGDDLPPLAALDREGWVLYVGTFSKILAPGLRMGWAHGPQALIDRLAMVKVEGSSGPFLTQVVARYAADGRLDAHIAQLRTVYADRCDRMLRAIGREIPDAQAQRPDGGFFIWLRLPAGVRATELAPLALRRGAELLPGPRCFADGSGDDYIRLAFSYVPTAQIELGIARIGAAIRELQAS